MDDEQLTTRQRVNRLKKTDPEFFSKMLDWRDQFKYNAKNNFLDRPVRRTFRLPSGKLLTRNETFEEVLDWITKLWYDDDESEYALA